MLTAIDWPRIGRGIQLIDLGAAHGYFPSMQSRALVVSSSSNPLLEAVKQRLDAIQEEGVTRSAEQHELEERLRKVRRTLTKLREEYMDLQRVAQRYERPDSATDQHVGPTEAIIDLLESERKHRMPLDEILDRLEHEIKAGRVHTTSDQPRKLISSTLSLLVKRGRLRRLDDIVMLPEEP